MNALRPGSYPGIERDTQRKDDERSGGPYSEPLNGSADGSSDRIDEQVFPDQGIAEEREVNGRS